MDVSKVIETIRSVIAEELEIPLHSLRNDLSLRYEYGLDSVAAVNIVFALECRLGIEINVENFVAIDSINDLRHLLSRSHEVGDVS